MGQPSKAGLGQDGYPAQGGQLAGPRSCGPAPGGPPEAPGFSRPAALPSRGPHVTAVAMVVWGIGQGVERGVDLVVRPHALPGRMDVLAPSLSCNASTRVKRVVGNTIVGGSCAAAVALAKELRERLVWWYTR